MPDKSWLLGCMLGSPLGAALKDKVTYAHIVLGCCLPSGLSRQGAGCEGANREVTRMGCDRDDRCQLWKPVGAWQPYCDKLL